MPTPTRDKKRNWKVDSNLISIRNFNEQLSRLRIGIFIRMAEKTEDDQKLKGFECRCNNTN